MLSIPFKSEKLKLKLRWFFKYFNYLKNYVFTNFKYPERYLILVWFNFNSEFQLCFRYEVISYFCLLRYILLCLISWEQSECCFGRSDNFGEPSMNIYVEELTKKCCITSDLLISHVFSWVWQHTFSQHTGIFWKQIDQTNL